MKTAFISDIHGNFEALTAVLTAIDKLGISRIYCAGDVAGYYCQINECCEELRGRKIPTVMGNHDWYMAGGGSCPRSKSVNDCLGYQRQIITADNHAWLKSLPVQISSSPFQIVHGGWSDPIDEYLTPSEDYFSAIEGQIFISGHTHIQTLQHYRDRTYCNPGSVGQPRDEDPRAAFAVLSDAGFQLHRVEYNMDKVFVLMDAAGFNDYYYGCLKTGSRTLRRLHG